MAKYILGCLGLAVVAVIILVIIALVGGVGSYNNLNGLKQGVDGQWAEVQNQYQRRADLIPNLVQTVSGAANFEKSTLTEVTQARASVGQVKLDPSTAPTDPAKLQHLPPACRLGKLSGPEGEPGIPRSAGPVGRDREPHHDGAQWF
jgi:LemA protein